jgi:hypothetical protein
MRHGGWFQIAFESELEKSLLHSRMAIADSSA